MSDILNASRVAIAAGFDAYGPSPYSPDERWPEHPFAAPAAVGAAANPAYAAVREALHAYGLDSQRFGAREWNPLSEIIRPGDTVVLKPNFVRDFRETKEGHEDCLITHGAILRAVADYAFLALRGRGRLIIADAPQNDADFDGIRRITAFDAIQAFYREHASLPLEVYDLRPERADKIDGVIVGHVPLPGDPAGYTKVNLGSDSAFNEVEALCHKLYGAEYDMREIRRRHTGGVHEYLISKTILDADVVISVPKLKTHKKVGLTVNLKNLVGINGNKNWLPHHREGTPSQGGDQFAEDTFKRRLEQVTVAGFKRAFPWLGPLRRAVAGPVKSMGKRLFGDTNRGAIRSGNWYGNDTCWRMVLDLNRILLYADAQGVLHGQPVRRFFSVVDGIIGGEGNGPLDPVRRPAGLVLAGGNPVAVDLACAQVMGFDVAAIPMLARATDAHRFALAAFRAERVQLSSNQPEFSGPLLDLSHPELRFEPHPGWKNFVERERPGAAARR